MVWNLLKCGKLLHVWDRIQRWQIDRQTSIIKQMLLIIFDKETKITPNKRADGAVIL